MAKVMVIGSMAQIEVLPDPEDEEVVLARCVEHSPFDGRLAPPGNCSWQERFTYGGMGEAVNTASVHRHADGG